MKRFLVASLVCAAATPAWADPPPAPTVAPERIPKPTAAPPATDVVDIGKGDPQPRRAAGDKAPEPHDREAFRRDLRELRHDEHPEARRPSRAEDRRAIREDKRDARADHHRNR